MSGAVHNPAVAARMRGLRAALRAAGAEAYLVTDPVDVAYASGFTGDDSWLVAGRGRACLITDSRFAEQADADCPDLRVVVRKGPMVEAAAALVRRRRIKRLAFDPAAVTVSLLSDVRKKMKGVRLVPVPQALGRLRMCKDASEQRAIRRAVRVAEEAWAAFRRGIRLGMTERRLAADLDHRMRLAGADGLAFPTIVAIDAWAARPHAIPGGRRLKRGSVLLVDFGAQVGGYVCDLTRVLFAGRIPPRARQVYEVVKAAQAAGIAAIRPGVRCADVDQAVRRVIADAGFGPFFRHGTGHGIGRRVHEAPGLASREVKTCLEPGMVVTVEPGIYLRGRFGIRIEDDVLVTRTGRTVLTHVEKELSRMVL